MNKTIKDYLDINYIEPPNGMSKDRFIEAISIHLLYAYETTNEENLPYYHKELITEDGVTTLPVPIIDHDGFLRLSNMVKCGTTWVWEEGVNPQYWLNIPKFPLKPKEISMTKEEQKQKAIALVEAYFNGTNILMKDPYAGIKDWTTIHNPSIWSYLGKFCENVDKYKIV